jgi:hypothetical protein
MHGNPSVLDVNALVRRSRVKGISKEAAPHMRSPHLHVPTDEGSNAYCTIMWEVHPAHQKVSGVRHTPSPCTYTH